MFYDKQPLDQRIAYKRMLALVGSLTGLFSESDSPYLSYRAHENIFCRYFEAENLARLDCSADAKKGCIGIGLKTWTGQADQKIAEFGKLRHTYTGLPVEEIIRKIAFYRNERIRITKKLNGVEELLYHIVKRSPALMEIIECSFDPINIEKIKVLKDKGTTITYIFRMVVIFIILVCQKTHCI